MRILRMRIIYAIINCYWSHPIALQKLSNKRSYKFNWRFFVVFVMCFYHHKKTNKQKTNRKKYKRFVINSFE